MTTTGPNATRLDFALLLAALIFNPLVFGFGWTTGGLLPDSFAYLALAEQLGDGRLVLEGFRHVDLGLVLPPVYPAAIGLGAALGLDPVLWSQTFTTLAMLAALPPLFLLSRRVGPAWLAALVVLLVAWHPLARFYGTTTLTEAPFIALLAWWCWALARELERDDIRPAAWAALGLGVAILALTRQIGMFAILLLLAALALRALRPGGAAARRAAFTAAACAPLAFAALSVAYGLALRAEGAPNPLAQQFRLQRYAVAAPALRAASDRDAGVPADYATEHAARRVRRELLPDGSEMRAYLVGDAAEATPSPAARLTAWPRHLVGNLAHLVALLGLPATALLVATTALGLLFGRAGRATLALFTALPLAYLAVLSLEGSLVARYVQVLFPFLYALLGLASFAAARVVLETPRAAVAAALVLCASFALHPPGDFGRDATRRLGLTANPLQGCRAQVAGAALFSLSPLAAYLAGGQYRIVPNDTLDAIAGYARRTGVTMLLAVDPALEPDEAALYAPHAWLRTPASIAAHPAFVEVCASADRRALLYRIAPRD